MTDLDHKLRLKKGQGKAVSIYCFITDRNFKMTDNRDYTPELIKILNDIVRSYDRLIPTKLEKNKYGSKY